MNTIIINGKKFTTSGKNISVVNGRIMANGFVIVEDLHGDVHVKFEGDLASLDCTSCEISGSVHGDVDGTNVVCGDVGGSVDATNVRCKNINGNVDAVNVSKS